MAEKRQPVRMPVRGSESSTFKVEPLGREWAPHRDFYHLLLTMRWTTFFGFAALVFVCVNAIFACLYVARPGSVAHVETFEEGFYFSVQTVATIGYGGMLPLTRYGNLLVATESLLGILGTALITGITFSKFARPTARVLFAEKCVVMTRDGAPHLMFRVANWRHNQVVEAQLRVILLVEEITREGETMRVPHPVPLVRDRTAMFMLSWSAMHRIDETSPFSGADAMEKLRARKAEIILSLSGLDETTGSTIHARHRYSLEDIVWNARFHDILSFRADGTRVIDYHHFHDVISADDAGGK